MALCWKVPSAHKSSLFRDEEDCCFFPLVISNSWLYIKLAYFWGIGIHSLIGLKLHHSSAFEFNSLVNLQPVGRRNHNILNILWWTIVVLRWTCRDGFLQKKFATYIVDLIGEILRFTNQCRKEFFCAQVALVDVLEFSVVLNVFFFFLQYD